MDIRKCNFCKKAIPVDAEVCPNCGKVFSEKEIISWKEAIAKDSTMVDQMQIDRLGKIRKVFTFLGFIGGLLLIAFIISCKMGINFAYKNYVRDGLFLYIILMVILELLLYKCPYCGHRLAIHKSGFRFERCPKCHRKIK